MPKALPISTKVIRWNLIQIGPFAEDQAYDGERRWAVREVSVQERAQAGESGGRDITPAPGTPQGGWGADMPLYATALVLSNTEKPVAVIDVDAIGFDREWTDKIIDAVLELSRLPREPIRLSCTHTHSGPNTFRLSTITEGLDRVKSYLDELPRRIAGAVWQAQQNLRPVRCAAGQGS